MPAVRRRAARTSAACDFCRRRKLGCDNGKPKCENCAVRDVACTYAERVKQERPSNVRIQKLEEENARLREMLQGQQAPLTPDRDRSVSDVLDISQVLSHTVLASPPRDVPFHGPSSAMFEPHSLTDEVGETTSASNERVKNQLLANTTRQRQLEGINMRAGKLDFGGFEPRFGMELLAIFWNRQHYAGSIIYRPVFMRDMACGGPYFSRLLLYAMLFSASKHLGEEGAQKQGLTLDELGSRVRGRFQDELCGGAAAQALFQSDVTTIQALLIMGDALFSWCDERSLSWHYVGVATSMIVDLGIHVDGAPRGGGGGSSSRWLAPEDVDGAPRGGGGGSSSRWLAPEDVEVHRRLFWAAFALDKIQAGYQGRPVRLRERDSRVPILFLDEYEELAPFHTLTYADTPAQLDCPTYGVSAFGQLCRLSILMDRIQATLYTERSCTRPADELHSNALLLHAELQRWRSDLPAHLAVDLDDPGSSTILPHTLNLLAMYNSLVILLHRPFVSDGHLQSVSALAAREAFVHCAAAALEIHRVLLLYKQHFCLKTVPYFVSYATYVSATIHVRMAAQSDPDSEAHRCLRNCLQVLTVHQSVCRAPARTLKILLGLMDRLKVHVGHFAVADVSACQGVEIRMPTAVLATPDQAPADDNIRPPSTSPELGLIGAEQVDFQAMLADFDIDELLKSFDQPGNDGWATTGADGGNGSPLPSQDTLFLPDSLFGFDFDMP